MFSRKKQPPIKSLLAGDSAIRGDIEFTEGLRLDGLVVGNITAKAGVASILVISETASIEGAVLADHIVVNGSVKGPICARELLELQPKARVEGDVSYKALEMHQGAVILGLLSPLLGDAPVDNEEKPTLTLAASNA
jgi:cytoskeletal protein CcmA (bactofilin family)